MRLYQHLQFQFDTPGFILVSSLFIFRTLFLLLIVRISNPLPLMHLLIWSFSLHVNHPLPQGPPFTFAKIICSPCLGSHTLQWTPVTAKPQSLLGTLLTCPGYDTPLCLHFYSSLCCIDAFLSSLELKSPRLGCCCHYPVWIPSSPCSGSGALHWANLFPHIETLPCLLRLWQCAGMPSTSMFPHSSWALTSCTWLPIPPSPYV